MQYTVIVEKGPTSWGAYVPDLPGCIAAGDTREEVLTLIREAIEFHVEGLRQQARRCRSRARLVSWWRFKAPGVVERLAADVL
jgi:predicted RNase H-like HicB family nuclease